MSFPEGFQGKLPDVGTTIFTVMSRRAAEQGAVNVGQGFPDYSIDPRLAACVTDAVAAGFNQYAPMEGNRALRAAIAAKITAGGGREVDPETEITVTCGGAESIYSAIQAMVGPGTRPSSSTRPTTPTTRRSASRAGAASTFRSRRRISAMTGIASREPDQRAYPAHPHQQSAQPGLHRGDGARTSMRWRSSRATGPSPCWPTKSTNTSSTTAASTNP